MIRHAIAATVTAATLTVTSATFLCLDPYHVGIMAGVTVMCCGWVLVEALRARAEYDDAAPAALRGWVLDPEDEAAFTPLPAPRPARVLRVMRTAPLALPGPSSLLYESAQEEAARKAQYAAWMLSAGDAVSDAEIAEWEWDDPGEW